MGSVMEYSTVICGRTPIKSVNGRRLWEQNRRIGNLLGEGAPA